MENEIPDEFPQDPELDGITLQAKKFSGFFIENREFYDCRIEKCTFQEMAFSHCRFSNCTFERCDLSLITFELCHFQNTHFANTRLVGIDWTKLDWHKRALQPAFHFENCNLNYGSFFGCSLKNCQATNCSFTEVDFSEADLTNTDLHGSDLSQARFFHTNLTQTNFTGAHSYNIDATCNTLKQTRFSLPEAVSLLYSLDIILDDNLEDR